MTISPLILPLAILLLLGGCNASLLTSPEILAGGLNSPSPDEHPNYSSDGRYLAFSSDRYGQRDIYLFDLQQRRLVPLPNLNRRDSRQEQPALSADGRFLAYVSLERGKSDIMIYDRLSQRSELLTANIRGAVSHPTISGDGRRVAFQTNQQGMWDIAIIER
jgi:Tol biopolymer transport system component